MFKQLLLFNIDIDNNHADYRKLLISSLTLLFAFCSFFFFSFYNYFNHNFYLFYVTLFFSVFTCVIYFFAKKFQKISFIALSTLFLLFTGILSVIYISKGQESVLFWALAFPSFSMTLMGHKQGLAYNFLFFLLLNFLLSSWPDNYFSQHELIRFNTISFFLIAGVFFNEYIAATTLIKLNQSLASIKQLNSSLKTISRTDGLTNLYNRRYFDEIFNQQRKISSRNNHLLTFAMIDIDNFKLYNDTYGHKAGDDALIAVASAIKSSINRPDDFTFRLGGEEFGVLFNTDHEKAVLHIGHKILKNVEDLHISHSSSTTSKYISISLGLYIIEASNKLSNDEIYQRCDKALYTAKQNGRNQLNVFSLV